MRIGPDNSGKSWPQWATRSPVSGSRMYFLNGRVWYNDPDPNYVRSSLSLERADDRLVVGDFRSIEFQQRLDSRSAARTIGIAEAHP